VGRKTFEMMGAAGRTKLPGMEVMVFSRTLRKEDHGDVQLVSDDGCEILADSKKKPGKDIWFVWGRIAFRSLCGAGLVDTVQVSIHPVLLGGGVSLLGEAGKRIRLSLAKPAMTRNGIVSLQYAIV
jgi:dihydrofolate reductase